MPIADAILPFTDDFFNIVKRANASHLSCVLQVTVCFASINITPLGDTWLFFVQRVPFLSRRL